MTSGRISNPLALLRAEAVATRRLARFYDQEAQASGSTPLALAAWLAYDRAVDIEAEAKAIA